MMHLHYIGLVTIYVFMKHVGTYPHIYIYIYIYIYIEGFKITAD
jgi:hypothetical protein